MATNGLIRKLRGALIRRPQGDMSPAEGGNSHAPNQAKVHKSCQLMGL